MNKTRDILDNDEDTIKFKTALLEELDVIFDLFNITPKDIGKILNVSRTQVDKYLLGTNNLSIFILKKLLNHFNITLSMFFDKVARRLQNAKEL